MDPMLIRFVVAIVIIAAVFMAVQYLFQQWWFILLFCLTVGVLVASLGYRLIKK